jgi:hypothetical protein
MLNCMMEKVMHIVINARNGLTGKIAKSQDTAQAINDIVDQICATGLSCRLNGLLCPDSGHHFNGIELVV